MTRSPTINKQIPSTLINQSKFKELFSDRLFHHDTREYIEKIIQEYTSQVIFMKKVREYAAMEIEARLFRSSSYWITLVATTITTSAIAYVLGHYIFR